jgi:hypothetical protein
MKIYALTRENAEIETSTSELLIFKNSLTEIYELCDASFFLERIECITREEAFELITRLNELLESVQKQSNLLKENKFIQLIRIFHDSLLIRVSLQGVRGIRGALNEICNGIKFDAYQEKIGYDREFILPLLRMIAFEVIEKMIENTPAAMITRKSEEIAKRLNFYRDNLEENSSHRFFRECRLSFKTHTLLFRLSSYKNRKIFSCIQTAFGSTEIQRKDYTKSNEHFVKNYRLLYLLSYLDLVLKSGISDEDLYSYSFKLYNSKGDIPVEFQVLQIIHESSKEAELRIRLKLALKDFKEGPERIITVEDIASSSDVSSFISSIQDFLVELCEKTG